MRGKEKCKALKEIRRQIAEENDIPYVVSQCTYQGECKGTCPKCESELRYLERELAIRQGLGKAVAVVGISASVCSGLTACSPVEIIRDGLGIGTVETAGVMAMPETEIEEEQIETEGKTVSPNSEEGLDAGQNGREKLPEEDLVMGEVLPLPEVPEAPGMELQGDIALPEEEMESSDESVSPLGETTP